MPSTVSISTTTIFARFRRLVHDLSIQLGKEIELITEGEETELDKNKFPSACPYTWDDIVAREFTR